MFDDHVVGVIEVRVGFDAGQRVIVKGDLRAAVVVYCAVISVMLWLALGVDRLEVRLGALLFYLSDLLVARDRFVRPGLVNRVVGLPIYYAGQLLLALAVGPGATAGS